MAKTISEEALQLKKRARRRLIGAIALVTLVVVFLPMVLEHEPKPVKQDINVQIPSPDNSTFTSKIVPAGPEQPATSPAPVTANPQPPAPPPKPAPQTQAAADQAVPSANDTEAAPPTPVKAATAKPATPSKAADAKTDTKGKTAATAKADTKTKSASSYLVQVAALNDSAKAKQLQEQMTAAGVKAFTEVVPTTNGNVTRVRAGPYATRGEAEKAQEKLKGMGLSGNIVPK